MIIHQEIVTYIVAVINFLSIYFIYTEKKSGHLLWTSSLAYLAADMGIHQHYPAMLLFFSYLGLTFYAMANKIQ